MANEKYFSILVLGKEAAEVEEGDLNASTGLPIGKVNKIKLRPGQVSIPNHSKVWGKKKLDKAGKPTGEIEFLKWGAKGGELIPIRYLEGCPSLDKDYQKRVLKLELVEEEAYMAAYINLEAGVNDFESTEDNALYLDFLAHHTFCGDNESRDPKKAVVYTLYNPENINKLKINEFKLRQKATEYVMAAEDNTGKLTVLANLLDIDAAQQDAVIFNQLFEVLEDDYKRILSAVDMGRAKFKHILEDLADRDILLVEDDDVILSVDGSREVLIKVLDSKDKIKELVDDFLNLDVFEAYKKVSDIKGALLQKLA